MAGFMRGKSLKRAGQRKAPDRCRAVAFLKDAGGGFPPGYTASRGLSVEGGIFGWMGMGYSEKKTTRARICRGPSTFVSPRSKIVEGPGGSAKSRAKWARK